MNLPTNLSSFSPTTIAIAVGIFLVILVLATMSKTYLEWSMSGAGIGFMAGVFSIVAIGVFIFKFNDGVIVKTIFNKYSNVLGAKSEEVTAETVKRDFDLLEEEKKNSLKNALCNPN